jgi:hypothetical protein
LPGGNSPTQLPSEMAIDLAVIIDILRSASYDVTRLQAPFDAGGPRNSWVDASTGRGSVGDLNLTMDEDSPASSPGIIRVLGINFHYRLEYIQFFSAETN